MRTDEQKERIKFGKNENYRLLLVEKMKTCNFKQEDHDLVVASHRKNTRLTFEEFKEKINNGEHAFVLSQQYDKKSIAFYCALILGKINLSKETLIEKYESGLSLDEIGDKYNIPREHMTYLRDFYGIKRKGYTFINRIQNEKPLTEEAKQIIIGSLLGDGCITKTGDFREKHSLTQEQYLRWKAEKIGHIVTDISRYDTFDNRSGKINSGYSLRTITHSFLLDMEKKFYVHNIGDRTKIIPLDIEQYLTPLVLAIWFMDDGSTDWGYRNGEKEYQNSKPSCKLCTDCFSKNDLDIILNAIKKIFNIEAYLYSNNKNGNEKIRIKFNTEESEKLINIIRNFIQKELLYKIDENLYLNHIQNKL